MALSLSVLTPIKLYVPELCDTNAFHSRSEQQLISGKSCPGISYWKENFGAKNAAAINDETSAYFVVHVCNRQKKGEKRPNSVWHCSFCTEFMFF